MNSSGTIGARPRGFARFITTVTLAATTMLLIADAAFGHVGMSVDEHKAAIRDAGRQLRQHLREARDEMDFCKDGLELARWRMQRELDDVRERIVNNADLCQRGLLQAMAGALEDDIRTCAEVLKDDQAAEKKALRSGRAHVRDALEKIQDNRQKWSEILKADRERLAKARKSFDRHAVGG
jgi:hypothetical protein